MWGSLRAELAKVARRPATWLLLALALALALTFTYLIPYAGATTGAGPGDTTGPPGMRGSALTDVLPAALVGNSIGGLPVFLGAIALIYGVLAVGGEYAWSTWKTVLSQGPSRLTVYTAKLMTLGISALVLTVALFLSGAVASAVIAGVEGQPLQWPATSDIAVGLGAGWLIATMWTTLGALLGVAMRGVALPIGLGLVWMLAVQNLLAGVAAPLLDWVADLQKGLPGPNAGSLAAALGSRPDTPGVAGLVGAGQASLVIVAYLAGFATLAGVLLRRRDIL